jgi:hypothetical protein
MLQVLDGNITYTAAYTRTFVVWLKCPNCPNSPTEVLDGVLDYPTYFSLFPAFSSTTGNLTALTETVTMIQTAYKNGGMGSGSFLENQDQPRLQSVTSDQSVSRGQIMDIWPCLCTNSS